MLKAENQGASNSLPINEGVVKKGGINTPPSHFRPAPPSGQAGSSSSVQGGERAVGPVSGATAD